MALMNLPAALVCGMLAAATASVALAADSATRTISRSDLRDRIEGGWAGQMIGVTFGAPTEFRYRGAIIPEDKLPAWQPEMVAGALDQDDLYVDMTFAQVLDDKGLDATTADFGAAFKDAKYRLWHANLASRRALRRGVPAELAGTPKYNVHANDIDFQIESDFIGMSTPGLPQSASAIALRAGRVMNHGDGIYGGIFVSCMYAAAFFETNPRKVVEAGLACLPARSPYALLIADVLAWSKQNPDDWTVVWKRIEDKWALRDPCPEGALLPFNIDAKLNGAYIALGLIYGAGDMGKTIRISTRAGQDSDCNPSSAAGILGVMIGYRRIPEVWKAGISAVADRKFSYTGYSYRTIVDSTQKRALEMIARTGGSVEGERITVRTQEPKPAALAVWDNYGAPVERIAVDDPRWVFRGNWKSGAPGTGSGPVRASSEKNAEAAISFGGTGVIVCGPYLPDGGRADVYLDGKFDRTVDVYPDEDGIKTREAVWHIFGLKPGKHTVRLVVRGEAYSGSSGAQIALNDLIVFR